MSQTGNDNSSVIPTGKVRKLVKSIEYRYKNKLLKIDGGDIKFKLVENILNKNINFYTWKSIEGNKGSFANGAVKKYKSTPTYESTTTPTTTPTTEPIAEPTAAPTSIKEELNFVLEFGGSGPKITVYGPNFDNPRDLTLKGLNLQKHINDNAYADNEKKIKKKEYESEEKEFFNQTKISDGIIRFQTFEGLRLILEFLKLFKVEEEPAVEPIPTPKTDLNFEIKHLIVIVSGGHATKHNDYPYERGVYYLQEGKPSEKDKLQVFNIFNIEQDYGIEKNKMIESIKAENICLYGPQKEAIFEISEGYSILVSENAKVSKPNEKINIDGDTVFFTGGSTTFQIGLITKEKITKEKITTEEIGVIEEDGITSDGKKKIYVTSLKQPCYEPYEDKSNSPNNTPKYCKVKQDDALGDGNLIDINEFKYEYDYKDYNLSEQLEKLEKKKKNEEITKLKAIMNYIENKVESKGKGGNINFHLITNNYFVLKDLKIINLKEQSFFEEAKKKKLSSEKNELSAEHSNNDKIQELQTQINELEIQKKKLEQKINFFSNSKKGGNFTIQEIKTNFENNEILDLLTKISGEYYCLDTEDNDNCNNIASYLALTRILCNLGFLELDNSSSGKGGGYLRNNKRSKKNNRKKKSKSSKKRKYNRKKTKSINKKKKRIASKKRNN